MTRTSADLKVNGRNPPSHNMMGPPRKMLLVDSVDHLHVLANLETGHGEARIGLSAWGQRTSLDLE